MKPRLKLHLDGHISVVRPGKSCLSAYEVKTFLRQHYGSLGAAALALQAPRWALQQALDWDLAAKQAGGHVGRCRQMLGLPNQPSDRSIAAAQRIAKRQARRAAA